jgi:succinate dehydrogenase / fumarate reductase cytochrome b subunit
MWAWLAQRIAGVALVPLIVLHIWYPYTLITQSLLIVVVVFHALLGIRVLLLDAGVPVAYEKAIFAAVAIAGLAIVVFMAARLFP